MRKYGHGRKGALLAMGVFLTLAAVFFALFIAFFRSAGGVFLALWLLFFLGAVGSALRLLPSCGKAKKARRQQEEGEKRDTIAELLFYDTVDDDF